MMTLKELFDKAELSEDSLEKLNKTLKGSGSNGKDLELIISNNDEYVSAIKYNEIKTELDKTKLELESNTKMLTDVDTIVKGKEDLEKQLNVLKETHTKEKSILEKKQLFITKLVKDDIPTLKDNYDYLLNDIDFDKIVKLGNGRFDGVDSQYRSIRESNSSFFEKVKAKMIESGDGGNPITTKKGINKEDFTKLSYTEVVKFKETNPQEYEQFKK